MPGFLRRLRGSRSGRLGSRTLCVRAFYGHTLQNFLPNCKPSDAIGSHAMALALLGWHHAMKFGSKPRGSISEASAKWGCQRSRACFVGENLHPRPNPQPALLHLCCSFIASLGLSQPLRLGAGLNLSIDASLYFLNRESKEAVIVWDTDGI